MAELKEQPIRREHDSMDDFEHLEHVQDGQSSHLEIHNEKIEKSSKNNFDMEQDMINFSSNQSSNELEDPRKATMLLLESEKGKPADENNFEVRSKELDFLSSKIDDQSEVMTIQPINKKEEEKQEIAEKEEVKETKIPDREAEIVLNTEKKIDNSWNIIEKSPVPESILKPEKKEECVSENVLADIEKKERISATETGESEFESEVEVSPVKSFKSVKQEVKREPVEEVEIAPKEIFSSMGIDAWFNPDRLNPKVAALIYWRDPKKSGPVFGCILGVLLSLAYFSLISVLAYLSLLILTGTIAFRIHNTVLQAIQKTSDGHPFQNILEMDLTLPAEKVHEVADVAVAHLNAAVCELRRLFLVEDFVDSLKFGVLLWCLTYVGSWFNGMTLIIIGVIALFTLPKVYETNKSQIDQNLALVQSKINELTAKVKAAIPFGKKEPKKEE
ncbi:reticulon-1 isoform X1 [Apis mellifera caucasica]|uniref:Reticulon-like protein n=1 Tax=Apis mellifera TaxID=7460 RepID=A0A7M7LMQ9_APIME|nr:reticulon-1 isoform X1 [Apis mellifera]KAG6801338.1 reticulon-1 isoform X1 [Apis mellifera caucasica]KAG9431306.1 reticulon-1 isoform X1 [Apis mellifera carnica]|eukprot:XP_006561768.2 reticulon-1 isoform X1 [Apis mellifera]